MDRSQRLTDGTRWWTFMRLLLFEDLMTSYTNARALGTASGLLAAVHRSLLGSRHTILDLRYLAGAPGVDWKPPNSLRPSGKVTVRAFATLPPSFAA